jgi:hypothetical protein
LLFVLARTNRFVTIQLRIAAKFWKLRIESGSGRK